MIAGQTALVEGGFYSFPSFNEIGGLGRVF
jgi:hypothetical protein